MKDLAWLIMLLTLNHTAWSQGTVFPITPVSHNFTITCSGSLPPSATSPPFGSADLTNDILSISMNIGSTSAIQGWVLTMASNGSLTPIFDFSNQVDVLHGGVGFLPVGVVLQLPSYYVASQSWQVTDTQAASIWAGLWYVQFTFTTGTDSGALIPNAPVPEPSSISLFLTGIGFIVFVTVKKFFELKQPA
jgi:hypothetical protein